MSTAYNHRKRSHRSAYKHRSAAGNLERRRMIQQYRKDERVSVREYFRKMLNRFKRPEKRKEEEEEA